MLQYAWKKTDYKDGMTDDEFPNVSDVNFNTEDQSCQIDDCGEISFSKCSHCLRLFYFEHLITNYHFHRNNYEKAVKMFISDFLNGDFERLLKIEIN